MFVSFRKFLIFDLIRLNSFMILFFCFSQGSVAEIFFSEDFETGGLSSGTNPKWGWKVPISKNNISRGMMFGSNDIYSVASDKVFTGKYAMKLNFAGRNNWCNQCGSQSVVVTQSDINAGCTGALGAPFGDSVYNKDNGFSQWSNVDPTSNTVCFNAQEAVGDSMFTQNAINVGDEILIPKKCDVNGIVGGSISRRSDCNKAINYLDGVRSDDFAFGQTISRRFYLYIPSETILPSMTLKLGYSHFRKSANSKPSAATLKLSVQRGLTLELTAPGGKVVNNFAIQKNRWYYFEEVFKRESSQGASDGQYDLYVSPAGQFDSKPVVTQANILIGELVDMSINGNFQHSNDASGYIYFDDIIISDGFSGPIDVQVPKAPTDLKAL